MGIKFLFLSSLIVLFTGLLTSCASTTEESIERVTIGMSKAMVLDIVGDPARTSRSNSVDQWIYRYYSGDLEKQMMVSFKGGQVIKISNFDPNDEGQGTYKEYSRKVKEERKSKDSNFKNLDD